LLQVCNRRGAEIFCREKREIRKTLEEKRLVVFVKKYKKDFCVFLRYSRLKTLCREQVVRLSETPATLRLCWPTSELRALL
jgi:hypothetical protein